MPADLPGYYWDDNRHKYFKIEKNHLALSDSQYSAQAVKDLRYKDDSIKAANRRTAVEKTQTVARSALLSPWTTGGLKIREELGLTSGSSGSGSTANRERVATVEHEFRHTTILNPDTSMFSTLHSDEHLVSAMFTGHSYWMLSDSTGDDGIPPQSWPTYCIPAGSMSTVTSVTTNRYDQVVVTTLADDRTGGTIHGSINPVQTRDNDPEYVSLEFQTVKDGTSIWTSAANPEYPLFACGMTKGWTVIDSTSWNSVMSNTGKQKGVDVMSVDWLDASVFIGSQRNGEVHLHDMRSGGSVSRLSTPGQPRSVCCIDSCKIIACGIPDFLSMYDLRMPQRDKTLRRDKSQRYRNTHQRNKLTRAVLEYQYRNQGLSCALAVSKDKGVLAAGSEDAPVELWSLYAGTKLKTPRFRSQVHHPNKLNHGFPDTATCLQFASPQGVDVLYATYKGALWEAYI